MGARVASWLLLAALVAVVSRQQADASRPMDKIVCYYGSWGGYRQGNGRVAVEDVDPHLCTHLIYSFVGIRPDGSVRVIDEWMDIQLDGLNRFTRLKQRNPALKTLIAIGGWNEGSTNFSVVAADAAKRATLLRTAVEFMRKYGFDGFDFDWEYPTARGGAAGDKANFGLLLREFHDEFAKHGYLLTLATAAAPGQVSASYDFAALDRYVDFVNVMAYDFHAYWDNVAGHNAPMKAAARETTALARSFNVEASITHFIAKGVRPEKIVLGLPAYAQTYTLTSAANHGPGAAVSRAGNAGPYTQQGGFLGYLEVCEKLKNERGWTVAYDAEQQVSYAYNGDQWISYDDIATLERKTRWAAGLGLGGVMMWSVETEDHGGYCGGERYPLLNAIRRVYDDLNGVDIDDEVPSSSTAPSTAAPSTTTTTTTSSTTTATTGAPPAGGGGVCSAPGYVRDPAVCSRYYYCTRNADGSYRQATFNCPSGLMYDAQGGVCNWPSLVEC